jgi:hypothetical protein
MHKATLQYETSCCHVSQYVKQYLYALSGAFPKLKERLFSFVMSVRLYAWNNSVPTGWISMKFGISVFFHYLPRKFQILLKSDKNNGHFTLTLILLMWRIWWAPNNASKWQIGFSSAFKGLRPLHIYWISRWILLGMKNISDKVVQKVKAHVLLDNIVSKIALFMRWCGKVL